MLLGCHDVELETPEGNGTDSSRERKDCYFGSMSCAFVLTMRPLHGHNTIPNTNKKTEFTCVVELPCINHLQQAATWGWSAQVCTCKLGCLCGHRPTVRKHSEL